RTAEERALFDQPQRRHRDQAQRDRHGRGRSLAQSGWQTTRLRRFGDATGKFLYAARFVDCRSDTEREAAKLDRKIRFRHWRWAVRRQCAAARRRTEYSDLDTGRA